MKMSKDEMRNYKNIFLLLLIFFVSAFAQVSGFSNNKSDHNIFISANDSLDITLLEELIISANALVANSVEGTEEGQFEPGTKSLVNSAIQEAETFLMDTAVTQKQIDSVLWHLADVCVTFEIQVTASGLDLVDDTPTKETKYLYANLGRLSYDYLLFGMHDATGYGVGWTNDDDRSDVRDVCGSYPAVYSEDMMHVLLGNNVERLRYRMTNAYNRGGILKMPWHQHDPLGRGYYASAVSSERIVETLLPGGNYHDFYKEKLHNAALFFKTLRGKNGESVPVIFRPFHEHTGSWFWWGIGHCTTEEYNDIWQFTVEYLRDSLNVHNLIYAASPGLSHVTSKDAYFDIYPGDDYVDMLGADYYFNSSVSSAERSAFLQKLKYISQAAIEHDKLTALTELGQETITTTNFFTDVLLDPIKRDSLAGRISFAAVWRNSWEGHHYAPYPGHPSVPDFIQFYEDPYTLFQDNIPEVYKPVSPDTSAPRIIEIPEPNFTAHYTDVMIEVVSSERTYLKYSFSDESYETMPYEFTDGIGTRYLSAIVPGTQGESGLIYIRGEDYFGNVMNYSVPVSFTVDTLQRPISWKVPSYSTADWYAANAPFLFDGESSDGTKIPISRTVYFRNEFYIQEADSIHQLVAFLKYDNGAVLYLNGNEIRRISMPDGEVNYRTWAFSNSNSFVTYTLGLNDLQNLKDGQNTLAVEMHQSEADSSDLFFDFYLFSPDVLIDYGAEWRYYSEGCQPADKKLGAVPITDKTGKFPAEFKLGQNYPNPFNPKTVISYQLSAFSHVDLSIYNLLGQKVRILVSKKQTAGVYKLEWDAAGFASGIYFYRISAGNFTAVHKMILVK